MRKGDVRIIVGVRSMRPSIMHDRQNDVSPRSTSAAILLLNKACVYLCILSNGHSTNTHTHTRTHARTHARARAHARTPARPHTHTHTHTHTQNTHKTHTHRIPANSPSLVRSLRHFRLARISVRGDRNLRHLSICFFLSFFRFPAIISYFPVIIPISVVGKKQGWRLDEVGRHVQEIQMQEKRRNRTRPTLTPIG